MMNLFADLPAHLPDELISTLLETADVRIERIVSHSHASPEGFWYDQDENEWVVVLKGAARLRFEDGTVEMRPGDFVNIPAHKKHRVEWTTPDEPTIWLAVHNGAPPVEREQTGCTTTEPVGTDCNRSEAATVSGRIR
jgi:cupin 2 domain-containing protein